MAIDEFTNAALTTNGNWVNDEGTFTISGNAASSATVAGNGLASANYTGIPRSVNQLCMTTFKTFGSTFSSGCAVRKNGTTYYSFLWTNSTWYVFKQIAGSERNFRPAAGHSTPRYDVCIDCSAEFSYASTLNLYVNLVGIKHAEIIVSFSDSAITGPGYIGISAALSVYLAACRIFRAEYWETLQQRAVSPIRWRMEGSYSAAVNIFRSQVR